MQKMNQGLRHLAESPLPLGSSSQKPKNGCHTHASPIEPSKPLGGFWEFSRDAKTKRV